VAGKARGRSKPNAVAEAIERIGGLTRATVVTGIPTQTLMRWRKAGRIMRTSAAVKIARASGVAIEKLAGEDT
jgi:predicted site-specific integrase-resolvase